MTYLKLLEAIAELDGDFRSGKGVVDDAHRSIVMISIAVEVKHGTLNRAAPNRIV